MDYLDNYFIVEIRYQIEANETGKKISVLPGNVYYDGKKFSTLQELIGHIYIQINKKCAEAGIKQSDEAFGIAYGEHIMEFGYSIEDATEEDIKKAKGIGFIPVSEYENY